MTAIERLRAACYLEGTPPPVDQVEADLAAVEALYQAATRVYHTAMPVPPELQDAWGKLGDAVRRAEAAQ